MHRPDVPDLEQWLRKEGEAPIPEPHGDLVSRTIRRVRDSIVVAELLRLATLEGVWKALDRGDTDAPMPEERQDP